MYVSTVIFVVVNAIDLYVRYIQIMYVVIDNVSINYPQKYNYAKDTIVLREFTMVLDLVEWPHGDFAKQSIIGLPGCARRVKGRKRKTIVRKTIVIETIMVKKFRTNRHIFYHNYF